MRWKLLDITILLKFQSQKPQKILFSFSLFFFVEDKNHIISYTENMGFVGVFFVEDKNHIIFYRFCGMKTGGHYNTFTISFIVFRLIVITAIFEMWLILSWKNVYPTACEWFLQLLENNFVDNISFKRTNFHIYNDRKINFWFCWGKLRS